MNETLYFTTGQAARELDVSQAQIRMLCESGVLGAESTPGGQWRIPADKVRAAKRDGIPPTPRPLPSDRALVLRNGRPHRHPDLLAEPSPEVVDAAEEVVILQKEITALELKTQKEQKLDFFRDRDRKRAEEEAARQAADQQRQAQAEAERQRQDRDNAWLAYAMRSVPYDARNEVEADIHEQVLAALETVRLSESGAVVQRVVDAVVARALKPWTRRKEVREAIEDARSSLPWKMKAIGAPTTWEIQARKAAATALENMRPDASFDEMRTVAREAARSVIAAFEAHKAAEADAELRQNVIHATRLPAELNEEQRELAIQAVTEAMAQLPQGTPRHKLEKARENTLQPLYDAVARMHEAEARKRRDRASRESVLMCTSWKFPYDLPTDERSKATEAVRVAIAALPEGTPERAMEEARDRAIRPILDAHERRKLTQPLVEAGLREILPFVKRLEAEWEFDKNATALEAELKPIIHKRLEATLVGNESPEDVGKTVRRLVRRELDIR